MTTPEFRFDTIHVASRSPLKRKAVELFLAEQPKLARAVVCVEKTADTGCPQPVGFENAKVCLGRRMAAFNNEPNFRRDAYVAIENYIDKNLDCVDRCAVAVSFVDESGFWCTSVVDGQIHIPVPPEFVHEKDSPSNDLGMNETIGERIHAAHPEVSAENWMGELGHEGGMQRDEQILFSLRDVFKWAGLRDQK